MSTFDSTKKLLGSLLQNVVEGKLQLPDFQRGWVWDDEHIRALLVSIARSFPIGAVMLLETGGETRFQMRPVEGVKLPPNGAGLAEELILDGQQRLTSITQVLKLNQPVATRDAKKREVKLHYYFDIERALQGVEGLADAIVAVDENRTLRSNFGRTIDLDLSTTAKEIAAFHFPCAQILESSAWEEALSEVSTDLLKRFMQFRKLILTPFREYQIPVITLNRKTSKAAVCLVFEKVNTGGVPLDVFELITATWAADGFNLRDDWHGGSAPKLGRNAHLAKRPLLRDLEPTDFLQAISLLHSLERRNRDLAEGKTGKAVTPVTAKREHILELPLSAYQQWSEPLTKGFEQAVQFLRAEGFHHPKFLPYRTQLTPLAALLTNLGERWHEPQVGQKLARWFWSGVFGELYGGAVETRIALDLQQLSTWVTQADAPEPATVQAASFNPNRLDTLRSRTSAAYRGLYVLLQREGARDFFWKDRVVDLDRDEVKLDIHHIFPQKWCEDHDIPRRVYNSVINKTAISYIANRKIGGHAPSAYLQRIQDDARVKLSEKAMDGILKSHFIGVPHLRGDDFNSFYAARKQALVGLIERATGKQATTSSDPVSEDEMDIEAASDSPS